MSILDNDKNANASAKDSAYEREYRLSGLRSECSADYVLPDYMGDVKRMLRYTATVVPCNKYVSQGELSFLSLVSFKIMYLDAENVLTEASFTADVELSEKIPESVYDASLDTKVHNVTVRLGGPRKISAKATLITDVSLAAEEKMRDASDFPLAGIKYKRALVHSADYYKCGEREYAEELYRSEDLVADEVDVVKYDAEAFIDAMHKTDNGVNLSGFINAYCILRIGDDLVRVEKCIPIEENLAVEGSSDDSRYIGRCNVTGVNINVNNATVDKDGGTALSVVMNLTVDCEAEHHKNVENSLIEDAFREGEKNECCYENFCYSELLSVAEERRKFSLTAQRGEENLHCLIERDAVLKNLKYEAKDGEAHFSADLSVNLVFRGADTGECFSLKLEEPISDKVKLAGLTEHSKLRLSAVPCEISPAFDSEKIYAEISLIVTALAEEPKCERVLSELKSEKIKGQSARKIIVYYPEPTDTLWSVAKKYGVSPEKIAKCNSIPEVNCECDLSNKHKIIIA